MFEESEILCARSFPIAERAEVQDGIQRLDQVDPCGSFEDNEGQSLVLRVVQRDDQEYPRWLCPLEDVSQLG